MILSLENIVQYTPEDMDYYLPEYLECKRKVEIYIRRNPLITTIAEENTIFPRKDKEKNCVAMTQVNLAEPKWIQIPCDKPLATHVFCHVKDYNFSNFNIFSKLQHVSMSKGLNLYHKSCVFINKKCLEFHWCDKDGPLPKNERHWL